MKQFRGTFVLAGVAVLVGLYIYFIEIKKKENDEKAKEASEKIFSVEADKIKEVKIKNSFGDFELEKNEQGQWAIKFPISDSADQNIVSSLVSSLAAEKFDEVVSESEQDLKPFGLDAPKLSVTLALGENSAQTVQIGGDGALPGKIYVKREGENKILFANNGIKTQIDKPLKELRDKRIYRGGKDEVQQLALVYKLKDNNQHITLEKKDGVWNITQPVNEVADKDAVQAFLTSLMDNLKAVDFPSEGGKDQKNIKKFNLDRPDIQVVLSDKEKKVLDTIVVGAKKDNNHYAYLFGKAPIYMVAQANVDAIVKKVDDFRDKTKPFQFKKDEVKQLTVRTPLADVNLVKKDNNWEMSVPQEGKQVNQLQVTNLLDKLSNLKVSDFLGKESPRGLTNPRGKVELKNADGQMVFSLFWGEKTANQKNYFAKTSVVEKPFGLEVSQLDVLPAQTLVEDKPKPGEKPKAPESAPQVSDPPLPGADAHDGHDH